MYCRRFANVTRGRALSCSTLNRFVSFRHAATRIFQTICSHIPRHMHDVFYRINIENNGESLYLSCFKCCVCLLTHRYPVDKPILGFRHSVTTRLLYRFCRVRTVNGLTQLERRVNTSLTFIVSRYILSWSVQIRQMQVFGNINLWRLGYE